MDLRVPVIGILRGVDPAFFPELMAAAFGAGLQALEVTMNTPGAERMVADCRAMVPTGHLLGMGTVRTRPEAERAVAAGAMFLVTPNLDLEVIAIARACQIPVVAGALTPTEVFAAWQAGADLIKVFPCLAMGGPRYIRALLGPFDDAPLVAVGGVDGDNAGDYLAAGVRAVGVGPPLFGAQALAQRDANAVAINIRSFLAKISLPAPEPGQPGAENRGAWPHVLLFS